MVGNNWKRSYRSKHFNQGLYLMLKYLSLIKAVQSQSVSYFVIASSRSHHAGRPALYSSLTEWYPEDKWSLSAFFPVPIVALQLTIGHFLFVLNQMCFPKSKCFYQWRFSFQIWSQGFPQNLHQYLSFLLTVCFGSASVSWYLRFECRSFFLSPSVIPRIFGSVAGVALSTSRGLWL